MKCVVECTWRTVHTVELPEDFDPRYLDNFPEDVLEELTTDGAELVDWEVRPSKGV